MVRTLITGAAGFTGRYVADKLRAGGHTVTGWVRPGGEAIEWCDATLEVELLDPASVSKALAIDRPDHVVHLAAVAQVDHFDVAQIYMTNIVGTRNLLQGLADLSFPPTSVLLASSGNVYGNIGGVIDESVVPTPSNDYGVSKLAMENVASLYRERLPLIVVRPFNYTGVGQSKAFLIPKIVSAARAGIVDLKLGNLNVARDFSDVRVVADDYFKLLLNPRAVGRVLNICSGVSTSLAQLLGLIESISGHRFKVQFDPRLARANEVKSLQGNPGQLTALVGNRRHIALADTLQWMLGAPDL